MNKYAAAGLVSLALTAMAQGAAAQNYPAKTGGAASSWYAGFGIGQTDANIPQQTVDDINASLSGPSGNNNEFTVVDKDRRSTGLKGFLGYSFNRNFAVEGGYASLGKSKVDMDFRTGLVSVGTFNMDYKMTAIYVDAVVSLPLNEKWSLIGRVGASDSKVSVNFRGQPISLIASGDDKTKSKIREKFGAGVDYNVNSGFTVRAEWERYKMPDPLSDELFNADVATLSFLFRF